MCELPLALCDKVFGRDEPKKELVGLQAGIKRTQKEHKFRGLWLEEMATLTGIVNYVSEKWFLSSKTLMKTVFQLTLN